jgi:hypothetical protein
MTFVVYGPLMPCRLDLDVCPVRVVLIHVAGPALLHSAMLTG